MFTGELSSCILSALRWWRNRTTYQAASRDRWDRLTTELARRRNCRPSWWDAPTAANPQIGRAGRLTPAQAWRANGGRHRAATA